MRLIIEPVLSVRSFSVRSTCPNGHIRRKSTASSVHLRARYYEHDLYLPRHYLMSAIVAGGCILFASIWLQLILITLL